MNNVRAHEHDMAWDQAGKCIDVVKLKYEFLPVLPHANYKSIFEPEMGAWCTHTHHVFFTICRSILGFGDCCVLNLNVLLGSGGVCSAVCNVPVMSINKLNLKKFSHVTAVNSRGTFLRCITYYSNYLYTTLFISLTLQTDFRYVAHNAVLLVIDRQAGQ